MTTDLRTRLLLAGVPLSSGAAVLVAVLAASGSLLVPALLLLAGSAVTAAAVWAGVDGHGRAALRRRVRAGVVAGVWATAAYDLVRYVTVAVAGWTVQPFAVFRLFGQMLVGTAPPAVLWVAGTAFHVVNGLGFAVGYAIVVRRPGLVTAVGWALVLEAVTVTLYPRWLGITALGEFVSMSAVGHLAYGLVLGRAMSRPVVTPMVTPMVGPTVGGQAR